MCCFWTPIFSTIRLRSRGSSQRAEQGARRLRHRRAGVQEGRDAGGAVPLERHRQRDPVAVHRRRRRGFAVGLPADSRRPAAARPSSPGHGYEIETEMLIKLVRAGAAVERVTVRRLQYEGAQQQDPPIPRHVQDLPAGGAVPVPVELIADAHRLRSVDRSLARGRVQQRADLRRRPTTSSRGCRAPAATRSATPAPGSRINSCATARAPSSTTCAS